MMTSSPFTVKAIVARRSKPIVRRPGLKSSRVVPLREQGHLATEVFDSAGVGERNFHTRMISDPSENVIEIGSCAFGKDDATQSLSSRLFRFSCPVTRFQSRKHLGCIKEPLFSAYHAIKHRYNRSMKPALDHGVACLQRPQSVPNNLALTRISARGNLVLDHLRHVMG
jgi:hypothetical protein